MLRVPEYLKLTILILQSHSQFTSMTSSHACNIVGSFDYDQFEFLKRNLRLGVDVALDLVVRNMDKKQVGNDSTISVIGACMPFQIVVSNVMLYTEMSPAI